MSSSTTSSAMTANRPLISVITATYNCADCLPRCLQSLAEQTCRDFEQVIIDGGSTDGTVAIIERTAQEAANNIGYHISERDTGIYNAWNKGVLQARGEWIMFLGADDIFYSPESLKEMASVLSQQPQQVRTCYGKLLSVDESGQAIAIAGRGWALDKRDFFQTAKQLPHVAVFQRRAVFEEHGGFDESLRISADFEFLCRELAVHEAVFADVFVARHTLRGISVHPKTALRAWRETRAIIARHQLPVPKTFIAGRMVKSYLFYLLWLLLPEQKALSLIDRIRRGYWKNR